MLHRGLASGVGPLSQYRRLAPWHRVLGTVEQHAGIAALDKSVALARYPPLRLEHQSSNTVLNFNAWNRTRRRRGPNDVQPQVEVMLEGRPLHKLVSSAELEALSSRLSLEAERVVLQGLRLKAAREPSYKLPRVAMVTVVLCDDARIATMNARHRNKNQPTDVLSFEMSDELDYHARLPIKLLGDVMISLDTAQRQASERGYGLEDEVRLLLVHGVLHLCGFDHEIGEQEHEEMAAAEQKVLQAMGWVGQGLISAAATPGHNHPTTTTTTTTTSDSAPAPVINTHQMSPQQQQQQQGGGRQGGRGGGGRPGAGRQAGGGAGSLGVLGVVFGSADAGSDNSAGSDARGAPGPGSRGGSSSSISPGAASSGSGSGSARKHLGSGSGGGSSSSANCSIGSASSSSSSSSATSGSSSGSGGSRVEGRAVSTGSSQGGGSSAGGDDRNSGHAGISAGHPVSQRQLSKSHGQAAVSATSGPASGQQAGQGAAGGQPGGGRGAVAGRGAGPVRLVALDMDGTLLNSSSRISSATAAAVRAVCQSGVVVVLATGKARPAALAAAREAGLEGQHLLVSRQGPGVFLQGLAVHGSKGQLLTSAQLQPEVVAQVFRHVSATYPDGSVSCVAFTGDDCVTLRMTHDLQALHSVYYEPLASVAPSLGQLLAGRPVRKLLLMTSPQVVQEQLAPHWNQQLQGTQAKTMQAVANMLEIVPQSVNKWAGMKRLLQHLRVTPAELLAVGDGDNDLELITGAGVGVAMGNATPRVKAAADAHVASNDDDGVAQALEQFVLRAAWRK